MTIKLLHGQHVSFDSAWKDIGIVEVALFQLLVQMGISVLSAVLPFFLLTTLGYNFSELLIFYFFWQAPSSLVIPYIHSFIKEYGLKHSIAFRSWSNALFWLLLPLGLQGNIWTDVSMLLPLFIIRAIGNNSSSVAYDIFLIHHIQNNRGGRTVALMRIMTLSATVIAPIVGGFTVYLFGFGAASLLSATCFLLSGIVLLIGKDEYINVDYSSEQIEDRIAMQMPKGIILGTLGVVAPMIAMWIFWPAFLTLILPNIASIGVFSAASTLIAMLIALKTGKKIDNTNATHSRKLLKQAGIRSVTLNMLRFVWLEPIGLAIIDSLGKINQQTVFVPFRKELLEWQKHDTLHRSHMCRIVSEHIYTGIITTSAVIAIIVQQPSVILYATFFGLAALSTLFVAGVVQTAPVQLTS